MLAAGLEATCPAEFPLQKHGGTSIGNYCSCSCGQPKPDVKCDVQVRQWPAPATGCGGGASTASLYSSGFCYSGAIAAAFSWIEAEPNAFASNCSPSAAKLPANFEDGVTICQATLTPKACEGGICVADAPGFKHCVMSTKADVTALCPTGYDEFKEYYLDFDDQGTCSNSGCYCQKPSGASCSTFGAQKCAYGTLCSSGCELLPDKTCVTNADFSIKVPSNAILTAKGSCQPTGTAAVGGSVTLKDKHILCCAP